MTVVAIADRARVVRPGAAQGQHLRVLPITGPSAGQPPYRLLDAETLPRVRVSEISAAGSVPELVVDNALDVRVFLMDGQELVGAKQNRILNTDVMVPPATKLTIPVSCVEQGRWRKTSETFSPGKAAPRRTRAAKQERVRASLIEMGAHDADQGAVWEEVEDSLAQACIASPTSALSDAYAQRQAELTRFRNSLSLPADAVGVAVFLGQRFQGLDLFDRHATLRYFWESLIDSYSIELLHAMSAGESEPAGANPEQAQARALLDRAAGGTWDAFRSPGEGTDWRLEDEALSASALVCQDSVIHLQLFPREGRSKPVKSRRRRNLPRVY